MYESPYIKLWIENNIIFCKYADKTDIDIIIVKQCVENRIEFLKGRSHPTLIDLTGVRSVTREAREYLSKDGIQLITAGAFIVGSPLTKMLGNVFLKINQPKVPSKLFTDIKNAKEWLKTFL